MAKKELTILDPQTWQVLKEQSMVLVKSGFLPSSIKTPEQAIAIALKGYELGLPIMLSYSHINIINGKPTISAELMMALILRNCPGSTINFVKMEDNECVIEASRPGSKMHTFKFSESDAKAAGLLTKTNWKTWPRAMYRSRCISELARSMFPDVIMGCSYTAEELAPDMPIHLQNEEIPLPSLPPQEYLEPVIEVSQEAPKKSFDKNNKVHKEKINKLLEEKNFDKSHWYEMYNRMHGKPSTELDTVIDTYASELLEQMRDKISQEPIEIPFG